MSDPRQGNWGTPDWMYNELNAAHKYTLDAAADASNAKTKEFFSEQDNALTQKWRGNVFCNPPYGLKKPAAQTEDWVHYGFNQVVEDYADRVSLVIPFKAETNFIHEFVLSGLVIADRDYIDGREKTSRYTLRIRRDNILCEQRLYRQRVEFGGSGGTGWFPSVAVTYWRPKTFRDVVTDDVSNFAETLSATLRKLWDELKGK